MSARTVSIDLDPRTRERFDRQLGGWAPSIGAHCGTPPPPTCPPTKPDPKSPPTPPTKPDPKSPPDEDDG